MNEITRPAPAGRSTTAQAGIAMSVIGAGLMVLTLLISPAVSRFPEADLVVAAAFIIGSTMLLIGIITWVVNHGARKLHATYGDTGKWFTRISSPAITLASVTTAGLVLVIGANIYAETSEISLYSSSFLFTLLAIIVGGATCTLGVVGSLAYGFYKLLQRIVRNKS